jgi:hypothetical protein
MPPKSGKGKEDAPRGRSGKKAEKAALKLPTVEDKDEDEDMEVAPAAGPAAGPAADEYDNDFDMKFKISSVAGEGIRSDSSLNGQLEKPQRTITTKIYNIDTLVESGIVVASSDVSTPSAVFLACGMRCIEILVDYSKSGTNYVVGFNTIIQKNQLVDMENITKIWLGSNKGRTKTTGIVERRNPKASASEAERDWWITGDGDDDFTFMNNVIKATVESIIASSDTTELKLFKLLQLIQIILMKSGSDIAQFAESLRNIHNIVEHLRSKPFFNIEAIRTHHDRSKGTLDKIIHNADNKFKQSCSTSDLICAAVGSCISRVAETHNVYFQLECIRKAQNGFVNYVKIHPIRVALEMLLISTAIQTSDGNDELEKLFATIETPSELRKNIREVVLNMHLTITDFVNQVSPGSLVDMSKFLSNIENLKRYKMEFAPFFRDLFIFLQNSEIKNLITSIEAFNQTSILSLQLNGVSSALVIVREINAVFYPLHTIPKDPTTPFHRDLAQAELMAGLIDMIVGHDFDPGKFTAFRTLYDGLLNLGCINQEQHRFLIEILSKCNNEKEAMLQVLKLNNCCTLVQRVSIVGIETFEVVLGGENHLTMPVELLEKSPSYVPDEFIFDLGHKHVRACDWTSRPADQLTKAIQQNISIVWSREKIIATQPYLEKPPDESESRVYIGPCCSFDNGQAQQFPPTFPIPDSEVVEFKRSGNVRILEDTNTVHIVIGDITIVITTQTISNKTTGNIRREWHDKQFKVSDYPLENAINGLAKLTDGSIVLNHAGKLLSEEKQSFQDLSKPGSRKLAEECGKFFNMMIASNKRIPIVISKNVKENILKKIVAMISSLPSPQKDKYAVYNVKTKDTTDNITTKFEHFMTNLLRSIALDNREDNFDLHLFSAGVEAWAESKKPKPQAQAYRISDRKMASKSPPPETEDLSKRVEYYEEDLSKPHVPTFTGKPTEHRWNKALFDIHNEAKQAIEERFKLTKTYSQDEKQRPVNTLYLSKQTQPISLFPPLSPLSSSDAESAADIGRAASYDSDAESMGRAASSFSDSDDESSDKSSVAYSKLRSPLFAEEPKKEIKHWFNTIYPLEQQNKQLKFGTTEKQKSDENKRAEKRLSSEIKE